MTNREKKEVKEGKEDCSLSTTDWVMFLSSEINGLVGIQSAIISAITAFMVGLLGVMVGYLAAGFAFISINIDFMPMVSSSIYSFFKFILCAAVLLVFFEILVMLITWKRINRHKEIIRKIIYGKTDSNKIREEWEEIDKTFYPKKKKDLEKSKNEQKEDPQVPQGDIKDIKESLQEIKSILGKLTHEMEGTKLFNLFCVVGSLFVAVGLAIIFATMGYAFPFGIQALLKYYFFLPLIGGCSILFAGVLTIVGAVYEWADLRKYPDKFVIRFLEELWHTKKWLIVVFFCLAVAILAALCLIVLTSLEYSFNLS